MDIEVCRRCGYPLLGLLNDARCPECGGTERDHPEDRRLHHRSGPAIAAVIVVTLLSCVVHPVVPLVVPTVILFGVATARRNVRTIVYGLGFVVALVLFFVQRELPDRGPPIFAAVSILVLSTIAAITALIDSGPVAPQRIVPVLAILAALLVFLSLVTGISVRIEPLFIN